MGSSPGPGPHRALPKCACLLLTTDSVPHVGVSKDLGVLAVFRRCGLLVALGRIHVFGPQGGIGTAHHLAVGGGSWEDDVVSSFRLEGRTGGLTARFRQGGRTRRRSASCRAEAASSPSLLPPPHPQQCRHLSKRKGWPLTSSLFPHPAELQASRRRGGACHLRWSWGLTIFRRILFSSPLPPAPNASWAAAEGEPHTECNYLAGTAPRLPSPQTPPRVLQMALRPPTASELLCGWPGMAFGLPTFLILNPELASQM